MNAESRINVYKRMLNRERKARTEAENVLQQRSRELYEVNQNLEEALALYHHDAFYLKTILDSAPDGILTISDGVIETANSNACRIFQLDPSQIIGLNPADLVWTGNSTNPSSENQFFALHCTEKHPRIDAVGKCGDQLIELELSASYGEIDGVEVVTWVLRDVSFISAMERQAALSQRLAGIGELAAGIAHEINTPVQFVHENTKFLSDAFDAIERVLAIYEAHCPESEPLTKALQEACSKTELEFYRTEAVGAFHETAEGAQRIAKIVSAVKDFSHPGTETMTKVDLNASVRSAFTVSNHQWKHIAELNLELAEALPEIDGFSAQLNQVIVNLIVNAADAIADRSDVDESHKGNITVRTDIEAEYVLMSVSDTGTGIDQADVERIFLPFFTTKPVGKGTGQGLAITHSIVVENHGGAIDIQSKVGEGTTFSIRLPIANPARNKPQAAKCSAGV